MSYEDLLFADNETWSETKMFLSPGEIVKSFCVEIVIDGQDIAETVATASVLGDITNETLVIDEVTGTLVNFTMNTLEQAHYFGSSGFYGTVSVKFSANETRYHESFSRFYTNMFPNISLHKQLFKGILLLRRVICQGKVS